MSPLDTALKLGFTFVVSPSYSGDLVKVTVLDLGGNELATFHGVLPYAIDTLQEAAAITGFNKENNQ